MTDFVRFDFDGSGRLDVREVYKLVKFHLWEYSKRRTGKLIEVEIPFKSLDQAGYTFVRQMGKGNQAIVQLATNRQGDARCIKCYGKSDLKAHSVEQLKEEYEAMRLVGCKSIARTYELFQDAKFYYMVNEPYYGGDFQTLRTRAQAQGVSLTEDWW